LKDLRVIASQRDSTHSGRLERHVHVSLKQYRKRRRAWIFRCLALGYGANWITEWYACDRRVLNELGLKGHEKIAGFIHIHRPEATPAPTCDEVAAT
jgi:hypothetical protein